MDALLLDDIKNGEVCPPWVVHPQRFNVSHNAAKVLAKASTIHVAKILLRSIKIFCSPGNL